MKLRTWLVHSDKCIERSNTLMHVFSFLNLIEVVFLLTNLKPYWEMERKYDKIKKNKLKNYIFYIYIYFKYTYYIFIQTLLKTLLLNFN